MITIKRNVRKNMSTKVATTVRVNDPHSLDDFELVRSPTAEYEFPTIDIVPPGVYLVRLDFVEASVSAKGQRALDTCQTFMNREGDLFHVRQRFVKDSVYYQRLIDALCAAGAPPGKNIREAVGVIETVKLGYEADVEIGSIFKRLPYEYKNGETQESLAEYFVDDSDG